MTNTKQLPLFTPSENIDKLVYELLGLVGTYKHQALHTEISVGRIRPFMLTLETVRLACDLAAILAPDSPKYKYMKEKNWKDRAVYEPYYAALEPRSGYNLYTLAYNNKNSSKRILLRFRTIVEKYGEKALNIFDKLIENNDKTVLEFKKFYGRDEL